MGYLEAIELIKNLELVRAGTPNRPLSQLEGNVRFIRDLLEAAEIGSTVFARDKTVEAEANVGMPVFFNEVTQRFERGLAQFDTDIETGQLVTSASAQIWGIVAVKHNATLADILLFGLADIDISAAVDGDVDPGLYYLSGSSAGMMVLQRPAVSVQVLRSDGSGQVFVNPDWSDFLHDHVHLKFDLIALPAGEHTPPTMGGTHTIDSPDSSIEGWLPADDAIFNGNAPAGAVFGYNLSANETLNNLWPPLPVDNAVLQWDVGNDKKEGFEGVPDNLIILDAKGIWWTSDCFEDVPWPPDLDTASSESVSVPGGCPRELVFAMRLWFTTLTFQTDNTVVNSLITDDPRIEIVCARDQGVEASTGSLLIRLALQFLIGDLDTRGFLAFKGLAEDGQTFNLGPVVEGIESLSSQITLSGDQTLDLGDGRTAFQGIVKIDIDTVGDRELNVQLTRYDGATEEFFEDIMYIGLKDDEESSFRSVVNIPAALGITDPKLKLRLRVLARVAGTTPQLTITGRRVLKPAVDGTPLPAVDTAIVLATVATLEIDEYIDFESDLIDVALGDQFFFTVLREEADAFTGEIGILQQVAVVLAGS